MKKAVRRKVAATPVWLILVFQRCRSILTCDNAEKPPPNMELERAFSMLSRPRLATLSAWITAAVTVMSVSRLVAQDLPFVPQPISPIPHLDDLDPNHAPQIRYEKEMLPRVFQRPMVTPAEQEILPQQAQRPVTGLIQEFSTTPADTNPIDKKTERLRPAGEPVQAMLEAAKKLDAAGLPEMARELRQRAEVADRELKKRDFAQMGPAEQIKQLSNEVAEFRNELRAMNARLEHLIRLVESRTPEQPQERLSPLTPQAVDPAELPVPTEELR